MTLPLPFPEDEQSTVQFNQTVENDVRPLPLIVADNWNFSLAYIDTNGKAQNYIYAAQDWYQGLAGNKTGWRYLKQTVSSTYSLKFEQAPYVATDGKTYQRDFINAEGLYIIAQEMRATAKRPQVQAIRDYLAKAGVFADRARVDPEGISLRLKGVAKRKEFAAAAQETHIHHRPLYGVLTDTQYKALFGMIAKQLEHELGGKVRDQLGELSLRAISNAEDNAAYALRIQGNQLTDEQQINICYRCAMIEARSLDEYCSLMNVDRLRNQPLLGVGR